MNRETRKQVVAVLLKQGRRDLASRFVAADSSRQQQQLGKIASQLEKQAQSANKVLLKLKPRNPDLESEWRKLDRAIDDFGSEVELME